MNFVTLRYEYQLTLLLNTIRFHFANIVRLFLYVFLSSLDTSLCSKKKKKKKKKDRVLMWQPFKPMIDKFQFKRLRCTVIGFVHWRLETLIEWPPFHRRHFQLYFLEGKQTLLVFYSKFNEMSGILLNWSFRTISWYIRTNSLHVWGTSGQNVQLRHYCDVIMGTMAFKITGLAIVYSTVYSGADQRKR